MLITGKFIVNIKSNKSTALLLKVKKNKLKNGVNQIDLLIVHTLYYLVYIDSY